VIPAFGDPSCNNFKVGDHTFDLTPLRTLVTGSTVNGGNGFKSKDGTVSMGMCGQQAKPCLNKFATQSFMSQFATSALATCTSEAAFWPQALTFKEGDSLKKYVDPDTKKSKGFTLKFNNGDYCYDITREREVTINFICDEQEYPKDGFTFTETSTCIYQVDFPTKHACEDPGNPMSGGLSGGSIMIIIFLVLVFVYCVGGVVYAKRFQTGKEGMELIPQKDFWCAIPNYTKIGCMISYQWVCEMSKAYCPCMKDKDSGGYAEYETEEGNGTNASMSQM